MIATLTLTLFDDEALASLLREMAQFLMASAGVWSKVAAEKAAAEKKP